MPGIFGCAGRSNRFGEALGREFAAPWTGVESVAVPDGVLGGHAFEPSRALHRAGGRFHFAVDGELALYRRAHSLALEQVVAGAPSIPTASTLTEASVGNAAVVDSVSGTWELAADWTGSFPVYYAERDGCLLFSSRLRPLARVLEAAPDPVGICEFMRSEYTFDGRTFFAGIRRVLPGQVLTFSPDSRHLAVRETSAAWAESDPQRREDAAAASEAAWEALDRAIRRDTEGAGMHALMLSAGWDSRLLLAALLESPGAQALFAYSHGDLRSRELKIVGDICRTLGLRWHAEPLAGPMYELETLRRCFDRVEHILFPPWYRAGALLAEAGTRSVMSGIYGEILGGHYGAAMLLRGARKAGSALGPLFGLPTLTDQGGDAGRTEALALLRRWVGGRPRFLADTFWAGAPGIDEAIDADIAADLARLERRGVTSAHQLIEAFVAEHRGTQYINAQALTCRASLDVAIPFADRELLTLASRMRIGLKAQNAITRRILRRHASGLLRFPTSASLFPAGMPILAQEASRAGRRLAEDAIWRLHHATRGRIGPLRTGSRNLEFLRSGERLRDLAGDLRGDLWDRRALDRSLANAASYADRRQVYPEPILKVYMADLMLR
jgi:asparagine synthetase B (glutamine-hydrolysing)